MQSKPGHSIRRISIVLVILLMSVLGGCRTTPAPDSRASGAASSAPTKTLATEQRRLAQLFRGTPVVFAMQPDGSLRIEVPLHYCFDSGKSTVKPPLAAVLDRIASSQRDESTRLLVSAPTDPGSKGLKLATERAVSARLYLVERGVAATRFTILTAAGSLGVSIVVTEAGLP